LYISNVILLGLVCNQNKTDQSCIQVCFLIVLQHVLCYFRTRCHIFSESGCFVIKPLDVGSYWESVGHAASQILWNLGNPQFHYLSTNTIRTCSELQLSSPRPWNRSITINFDVILPSLLRSPACFFQFFYISCFSHAFYFSYGKCLREMAEATFRSACRDWHVSHF
jgi:hypothetical protein